MTGTAQTPDATTSAAALDIDDICPICHLLLYDPVKTRCNHVLCASCMAQWADVSSMTRITPSPLDLDISHFDPNHDPLADLSVLEANCPMCRTPTTATPHAERKRTLEEKYPTLYAERREEEAAARGSRIGQDGVEGMTILIGNKHRLERSREDTANKHDWTFFVRVSRPELIQHVRIYLHPTFRPPSLTLTQPPFEVRRLGWGYFNIECALTLKEPYVWMQDNTDMRQTLFLDWMLSFEGRGRQGRVRAKVKKMESVTLQDAVLEDDSMDEDYSMDHDTDHDSDSESGSEEESANRRSDGDDDEDDEWESEPEAEAT